MEDIVETHYDVLGVSLTASKNDIKLAHRNKAKELHPDRAKDRESEFRQVQKAWECLREQELRKSYDSVILQQKKRRESEARAALPIKMSELEEAEDETGQLCHLYDCRCGEVIVWQENQEKRGERIQVLNCPGCSLGYLVDD